MSDNKPGDTARLISLLYEIKPFLETFNKTNGLVKLNTLRQLPAVDGSLLTNLPTTGITGSGIANQLVYWTGAGTVGNLAVVTYPSLVEVSYVKGVTSNIQTQLNSKGTGDVTGPASSITDAIALFDGITGKLLKDSGTTIASLVASITPPNNPLMAQIFS